MIKKLILFITCLLIIPLTVRAADNTMGIGIFYGKTQQTLIILNGIHPPTMNGIV